MPTESKQSGKTSTPLWRSITDELLAEIRDGRFAFGDRFYTIDQLSDRFDVSAITSRRALDELTRLNCVEKIQGKGTFVTAGPTVQEIFFLVLEPDSLDTLLSINPVVCGQMQGFMEQARAEGCRIVPVQGLPDRSKIDGPMAVVTNAAVYEHFFKKHNLLSHADLEGICFATISYDPLEEVSSVVFDYRKGARLAINHLYELGHRRIGYLTQGVKAASAFPRFDGYMKAVHQAGLPFDLDLVSECGSEPDDVARAMSTLMALDDPPTAILSFNYVRALRAEAWCLEHGLHVPDDMAIACFDNTWDTAHCTVPLTSIDLHWEREGAEAVKLVLEMVRTGDTTPRHVFIEPELVVRDSTGSR